MDRGAWWATVYGVTKSQIGLKRLSVHTHTLGWCGQSHRARHSGVGSQVGLTAANKASGCDGTSSRAIQNPQGGCHQGVSFNMLANLEDPVVATGLEKVNPHPNSQEG